MTTGTAESYRAFVRNWWRPATGPGWPGGRMPGAGRKTTIGRGLTYDEALRLCRSYNDTHKPGKWSRKAEFERE